MANFWVVDLSGWTVVGAVGLFFIGATVIQVFGSYQHQKSRQRLIDKIKFLARETTCRLDWLKEALLVGQYSDGYCSIATSIDVEQTIWQSQRVLDTVKPCLGRLATMSDTELQNMCQILTTGWSRMNQYTRDMPVTAPRPSGPIVIRMHGM